MLVVEVMKEHSRPTFDSESKRVWLRDCLHELRRFAKENNLAEADDALRQAIIRVSLEADIPTLLSVADLTKDQNAHSGGS